MQLGVVRVELERSATQLGHLFKLLLLRGYDGRLFLQFGDAVLLTLSSQRSELFFLLLLPPSQIPKRSTLLFG